MEYALWLTDTCENDVNKHEEIYSNAIILIAILIIVY